MAEEKDRGGAAVLAVEAGTGLGLLALSKKKAAVPPGPQPPPSPIVVDGELRKLLQDILAAIQQPVDGRLDAMLAALNTIIQLLSGQQQVAGFVYRQAERSPETVDAGSSKNLLTFDGKGSIAWMWLISDSQDIEYTLKYDDEAWVVKVADLVNYAIDNSAEPGVWLDKAAAGVYVVNFWIKSLEWRTGFELNVANTGGATATISKVVFLRKIYL